MSPNSKEVSHRICTVPVEREEHTWAIESIVHRFFGEHAKIIRNKSSSGAHNYEVQLPAEEHPSPEELQKLHNLCRIKVHDLGRVLGPLPKLDKGEGAALLPGSDLENTPPAPPKKDRPDTIRIRNIPITYTSEVVEIIVQKEFCSKPRIHSLALHTKEYFCATVTFPDEEYGFPTEQLQKVYQERQSRLGAPEIQYDADFFGFTTLYNASSERLQVDIEYVCLEFDSTSRLTEIIVS
ncbi:hypothetical protein OCU04_011239 [Sclerotinia nivalis]|uniref:Uncharacterized protein n=1 Tax=Sclerotinia nivalis TaxID=352851 RepID=A0A9X0DE93_9HELO|nr:hypothetical protein OCU04_011239 [Sclerotinia nivalis]